MNRMIRRTLASATGLALLAVGGPACSTFASHEEYTAYRNVRMATEERERLVALQQYAEHHHTGYWIDEIQAARDEAEEQVWLENNHDPQGLSWYLRVFPDGRFVGQARPRLAAMQHVTQGRDEEAAARRELARQQRATAADQRRRWVTQAMQFWVRTLLNIPYGSSLRRIGERNEEFAGAFGGEPAPVCSAGEYCIKHYGQLYHIPVPGATRIDRHMDVYLRLVIEDGRLRRAELLLPNKGFSRWYEMENRTVVTDEDPEQRMMAINWALDRLQPIIRQHARNAQRIDDFVPEPIPTLEIHADASDTDEAPPAPTAEAQPQAPASGGGSDGGAGGLDELLQQAAGAPEETETPEATQPDEVSTLVLPINLMAFRSGSIRVVAFAAGDEDYGEAYDGIFFERIGD